MNMHAVHTTIMKPPPLTQCNEKGTTVDRFVFDYAVVALFK